ncbi:related to tRNA-splicing endonuclease beta chain [Rhynchosporium secalis]|uniref:tRNA-intron lyase n=1 Tax=Rhynchosporium secalis TaxID=38038 RepID=A0A1E1MNJ2_RHYSE|nr:related to tRNA-splicing endonuclease beta chain [Rhynchosporium secalis]
MADTAENTTTDKATAPHVTTRTPEPRGIPRSEQLNRLYALPAPLRTFPLPTFVPHNPLSLFHILYVWLSQTIKADEPSHIEPLYQGWFSPETRSVHVTDHRSVRGLWEQGFYGKGNLSRSEPSWLSREKTRLGTKTKITSEEVTRKRRADRQVTKWERARKEREAIDLTLQEEAEAEQSEEIHAIPIDVLPLEAPAAAQVASDPKISAEEEISLTNMSSEYIAPVEPSEPLTLSTSLVDLEALPDMTKCFTEDFDEKNSQRFFSSPTGPLALLALPDSLVDVESLADTTECFVEDFDEKFVTRFYSPPTGPLELLALPNSIKSFVPVPSACFDHQNTPDSASSAASLQSHLPEQLEVGPPPPKVHKEQTRTPNALDINSHLDLEDTEIVGGSETNDETADGSDHSEHTTETSDTSTPSISVKESPAALNPKRRKSVRFSPTIEKNTFIQTEPPSPEKATSSATISEEAPLVIKNQEHVQLTLEEAFFLSYALGALQVLNPDTNKPMSNEELFYLARETSYFPPQANLSLSPDDPFMINYVVYHHFRSLGWVLRSGVKFSVDYMLYTRGPVFTHAEFAVLVLPSYIDPYWRSNQFLENYVKGKEQRTWAWLSCINRVITQVKKTLILTYVDIPKPMNAEEERALGIDGVLGQYKVREVVMRRWAANRMRD